MHTISRTRWLHFRPDDGPVNLPLENLIARVEDVIRAIILARNQVSIDARSYIKIFYLWGRFVARARNIKNTLVYTHLIKFTERDEFISKIAKSDEEFAELIELGFDYVGPTPMGNSAFRKRK